MPGAAPTPVTLHYRSERFNQNGTMHVTLPDGETFTGRYLEVTSDTDAETLDPFWGGWGVGWAGWGPWSDDYGAWVVGADVPTFVRNYSGTVIATLLGDRGGRMRCRFRLAEPEQGHERRRRRRVRGLRRREDRRGVLGRARWRARRSAFARSALREWCDAARRGTPNGSGPRSGPYSQLPGSSSIHALITSSASLCTVWRPSSGMATPGSIDSMR